MKTHTLLLPSRDTSPLAVATALCGSPVYVVNASEVIGAIDCPECLDSLQRLCHHEVQRQERRMDAIYARVRVVEKQRAAARRKLAKRDR